MRFLIGTFLIASGILSAMLFWWRPAPALISVTPIDWAAEYEKQHTPAAQIWGAMEAGRELIRASKPHVPFTEFIDNQTKGRQSRIHGENWRGWADRQFSNKSHIDNGTAFLRPDDPLAAELSHAHGYVELQRNKGVAFFQYHRIEAADLKDKNIPSDLHFPYRTTAMALFAATVGFLFFNRYHQITDARVGNSSAGKGCKAFITIGAAGVALIVLPFLYGWINDSPPFVFIGGFIVICGSIGLIMFGWQAVMVSNMIQGKGVLATWTYTSDEWQQFIGWSFKEETSKKMGLLALVSVIIIIVGGGFCLLMGDEAAGWVFVFFLGIIVFLWLLVLILPRLTLRRNRRGPGEVFIGASGIYCNGTVHSWSFPGSRFESAHYESVPFPLLSITYSYLMVAGRSFYFFRHSEEVHLPVPRGKEAEAKAIVKKLTV